MEELAENYVNLIADTDDFKRLLSLKKLIDEKYSKEIVAFKTAESKYNDAASYGKYYPGLSDLKKNLSEKKAVLYNKSEVKEYLELERKIGEMINQDMDDLKGSISNKFKTGKALSCNKEAKE